MDWENPGMVILLELKRTLTGFTIVKIAVMIEYLQTSPNAVTHCWAVWSHMSSSRTLMGRNKKIGWMLATVGLD